MVKGLFQVYLSQKKNSSIYSCYYCRAHLAIHEDLISKSFQGSRGRAYLFNNVVNVHFSDAKQRVLLTGIHFVADVFCSGCDAVLGWKYERAFEPSQRYKEGKVIIELAHLIKDNCWDQDLSTLPSERNLCSTMERISTFHANGIRPPRSLTMDFCSQDNSPIVTPSTESIASNGSSRESIPEIHSSNVPNQIANSPDAAGTPHLVLSVVDYQDNQNDTSPLLSNVATSSQSPIKPSPITQLISASRNGWRLRKRLNLRAKSSSPSLDSLLPVTASSDDDDNMLAGREILNRGIVSRSSDSLNQ